MKTRITLLISCFTAISAFAQMENAAFTETGRGAVSAFVTDYQALGINPANLALQNRYNKKYTFGLGATGISFYSESFTRKNLVDGFSNIEGGLTYDQKRQAGIDFANSDFSVNAYVNLFGFAINTENAGSFAFSVNARGSYYSNFNEAGANHLFNGYLDPYFDQWEVRNPDGSTSIIQNQGSDYENLDDVILGRSSNPRLGSDLYSDTRVRALAFTEFNVGYGRHVYENEEISIYAGVGLKYVQGIYAFDLTIEDNEVIESYTAASPALDIDFGDGALTNPSFEDGSGYSPVGDGFGLDFGITAEISDQFRVSASITDIGSILFDGNVYKTNDTLIYDIETEGLDSYNVFSNFDVFAGDDGQFDWIGEEERRVLLPTQIRGGLGYFHNEKLRFGMDIAIPLNDDPGNIERMAFAFGTEFLPTPSISLSAGIGAGDNYGFRVPFGVNFVINEGSWELGVATRDIMYAFREDRPNISIVAGLLRFRFGDMTKEMPSRMF